MLDKKIISPFITLCFVVTLWELVARFSGWSSNVFPAPLAVLNSMIELIANGKLISNITASLFRVGIGFSLAALLGIPLGIILGRVEIVKLLFNPLVQFLRPISPLAWIPLALLWFGIGDPPAIFLIFLASFFPIVVSTSIAVEAIKPTYFQVAANFNFSRVEVLTKIIIPAITPSVVTTLRLSVGIAWLVVVAAEMIAVQSGLGYLILDARNSMRMDYVMVAMITIGTIGLLLDFIMYKLGNIESAAWGKLTK